MIEEGLEDLHPDEEDLLPEQEGLQLEEDELEADEAKQLAKEEYHPVLLHLPIPSQVHEHGTCGFGIRGPGSVSSLSSSGCEASLPRDK